MNAVPRIPPAFAGVQPQILILDVDGVLTSNVVYLDGGQGEWKPFFIPDGTGIRLLGSVGVRVAFVSGRASAAVHRRAEELGVFRHLSGVGLKGPVVRGLLDETGIAKDQAVYVGDDLQDLSAMEEVGLPVAVANAHPEVKTRAVAVTEKAGGDGAVREVCEWILVARGDWETARNGVLEDPGESRSPERGGSQ